MSDVTTQENKDASQAQSVPEVGSDNKDSGKETPEKKGASVPSWRLKEESDKRRDAEKLLDEYKLEQEAKWKQAESQRERDIAAAKFGEEAINNEKVQEYKNKYEGMTYGEAIKLAGAETHTPSHGGIPRFSMGSSDSTTITGSQLATKSAEEYTKIRRKAAAGEMTINRGK